MSSGRYPRVVEGSIFIFFRETPPPFSGSKVWKVLVTTTSGTRRVLAIALCPSLPPTKLKTGS